MRSPKFFCRYAYRPRWLLPSATLLFALGTVPSVQADSLGYLRSQLAATPNGGWVQVNTNAFSSAWATPQQGGLPPGTYSNPAQIVRAWGSIAWDSQRNNLMLWGGGHANYMGNEMYIWNGSDGAWTRGSLPTRLLSNQLTVDNITPQSAHVYDNSLYVPINDRFVTFGGAAFNGGGVFTVDDGNGNQVLAGPWAFDPAKADPNKVGGLDGSGYVASLAGGRMWSNLRDQWSGSGDLSVPSHLEGNSAYRTENGKDVIYVASDVNASGFKRLLRYELGDVVSGTDGRFTKVGFSYKAPSYQSAATIDLDNQLYIQTAPLAQANGFGVWDISKMPTDVTGQVSDSCIEFGGADPNACLADRLVTLHTADGAAFEVNDRFGIGYDARTGKLLLWDGEDRGIVWQTEAEYDANGNLDLDWLVTGVNSTTSAQPLGKFGDDLNGGGPGVLGKWQYIDALGAFIALDQFQDSSGDAGVWLYKPLDFVDPGDTGTPGEIPEPGTVTLMALSLVGLLGARRRSAVAGDAARVRTATPS